MDDICLISNLQKNAKEKKELKNKRKSKEEKGEPEAMLGRMERPATRNFLKTNGKKRKAEEELSKEKPAKIVKTKKEGNNQPVKVSNPILSGRETEVE